jgi:hypothetical protein
MSYIDSPSLQLAASYNLEQVLDPGAGDEQGPPEPIVDRHFGIDNDGKRLENGAPASPQQIDILTKLIFAYHRCVP